MEKVRKFKTIRVSKTGESSDDRTEGSGGWREEFCVGRNLSSSCVILRHAYASVRARRRRTLPPANTFRGDDCVGALLPRRDGADVQLAGQAGSYDQLGHHRHGGALSVSLSTPTAHHGVLLLAILLIALLLHVEARRYRFYDTYRYRVRQFERHYFGPIFSGVEARAEPWLKALAEDLKHPHFHISLRAAATRRLRRNYIFMFGILLLAWALKITSSKLQDGRATVDTLGHLRISSITPPWGPYRAGW